MTINRDTKIWRLVDGELASGSDYAFPSDEFVRVQDYDEIRNDLLELCELFHMELFEKDIWDHTHLNNAKNIINKWR